MYTLNIHMEPDQSGQFLHWKHQMVLCRSVSLGSNKRSVLLDCPGVYLLYLPCHKVPIQLDVLMCVISPLSRPEYRHSDLIKIAAGCKTREFCFLFPFYHFEMEKPIWWFQDVGLKLILKEQDIWHKLKFKGLRYQPLVFKASPEQNYCQVFDHGKYGIPINFSSSRVYFWEYHLLLRDRKLYLFY
jgi:hypothetical protein